MRNTKRNKTLKKKEYTRMVIRYILIFMASVYCPGVLAVLLFLKIVKILIAHKK